MEFVEVMKRAQEMCKDFTLCGNCPIYYPGPFTCWSKLFREPEKAENAIINYYMMKNRRRENAAE